MSFDNPAIHTAKQHRWHDGEVGCRAAQELASTTLHTIVHTEPGREPTAVDGALGHCDKALWVYVRRDSGQEPKDFESETAEHPGLLPHGLMLR